MPGEQLGFFKLAHQLPCQCFQGKASAQISAPQSRQARVWPAAKDLPFPRWALCSSSVAGSPR